MISRKTHYVAVVTALAALFTVGQEVFALNNPWVLSIRSGKESPYLVGEPVIVKVALTNIGASTEKISPQLDGLSQSAMYYVSSDGEKFLYVSAEEVVEPGSPAIPVAPGESIYHDEMLLYDARTKGWLFRASGRYYIRVDWHYSKPGKYDPADPPITLSDTTEISVVDAQGKDRDLVEVLKSKNVMQEMMFVLHKPESVRKFERIAESNTVYAPYAAVKIAELELRKSEFGMKSESAAREHKRNRLHKALRWLKSADQDGFPLRAKVIFLMGQCQLEFGKSAETTTLFERLKREYPRSSEAQLATQRLPYLKGAKNTHALEDIPTKPYERLLPANFATNEREVAVDPELRKTAKAVFRGFLASPMSGDVEQSMRCVAEDLRRNSMVWNRAKQREEFQEDIDKIDKLRRSGVSVDLSARFLSIVRSDKDVVIKAVVSYRAGSKPTQDQTIRCRLRKYGDRWLIQRWDTLSH